KGVLDFTTLVCLHCPNPVCMRVCNYSAIKVIDSVVTVFESECVGCGDCIEACPRMFWDSFTLKAINCDLCGECIKPCPEGALKIKTIGEK
ncbi:MAG: 4Fe-4S dicluster domain-containing protein, partial [Sphaerochaetaceae bacterium]